MEAVYLINDRHLGDTMVVSTMLHSRHMETGEHFALYGPTYIPYLFELFDYKGLHYKGLTPAGTAYDQNPLISIMPYCETGRFAHRKASAPFIGLGMFTSNMSYDYKLQKVRLPSLKAEGPVVKESMVCFQFDSRSVNRFKYAMLPKENEDAIKRFRGGAQKIIGIGGYDTIPYLPYEFRLGLLRHILGNLLSCEKFIGVDSGLSHLAGTAGVDADIIIMHMYKDHVDDLLELYQMMYPTLRCHRRYATDMRIKFL
jgi:hypothetical protein